MSNGSKKGWIVTFAGTGINLALGVLYSWSVISKNIPKEWGWSEAEKAMPYTIACLVFAFMMVPAGRMQDLFGPRLAASLGGILCGAGLILASKFTTIGMFILGFGVLAGTGIGFGYASTTPAAVKWFPPAKTGMIAGIVVAGFGLASVYIAPVAAYLIDSQGVSSTIFILGLAFLVVVVLLAQFIVNPPPVEKSTEIKESSSTAPIKVDFSAGEMLKTSSFYTLWFMYVFNAGAGLLIIGKLAKLVEVQASFKAGFILVALLAIGNAFGRLLAGAMSDKLGRTKVLRYFTVFQCILMFLTPFINNAFILIIFSMCIGMNYGSNLALFPSITKDFFGLKNFGVNYGLIFTSWGIGSILTLFAGKIYDIYGKFDYALFLSGALLVITIFLSFILKKPEKASVVQ